MAIAKEKIKLLQRRRLSRMENKSIKPEKEDWLYLLKFSGRQKKLLIWSVFFLILQGLFEVALIIISHRYLRAESSLGMVVNNRFLFVLILLSIIIYLISAYLAIKKERTFIIRMINDLRERWFKLFLHKRPEEHNLEQKSMLIAKVSYHLPLLSTGLNNSLAGALRWLLFVSILLFLSFIFGYQLLLFSLAAILFSLFLAWLAYYVSHNYVTRETTFYSHIIRWMDFNLSDWQFVKSFHRENNVIKEFRNLVELDTYFRVRRDLWLRFSVSIVFVLLVLLSFLAVTWGGNIEYFFGSASLDSRFLIIIALLYFSRLMYESVRAGLYSVPFLLGLKLSVPKHAPRKLGINNVFKEKNISFKSAKTRLFKKDKYKSFRFDFERGGRYLITGGIRSGRSGLAKIFTGKAVYGRRSWLVLVQKNRYFYNEFFNNNRGFFYIDPKFKSQRSLLEVVTGKEKNYLNNLDLARASNLINSYPELKDVFFEKEDWRFRSDLLCANIKNTFLLQLIYCLLNKPYLIAIDNFWLDRKDPEINKLLILADKLLPESIIVVFDNKSNNLMKYNYEYEI